MTKIRCPVGDYRLYVSNIGKVYAGRNCNKAIKEYNQYVKKSKSKKGRASGEQITLVRDNEIIRTHWQKGNRNRMR